jgi:hypothetical protein
MRRYLLLALAGALVGCGGGNSPTGPPTPVATPIPAASITATGAGALVVHPSADRRYLVALETPIRIIENGGGTADWNFARMSLFLRGAEVERSEQGADVIRSAGFNRVGANSNTVVRVVFRFNADDFDRVDLTLGFGDIRDGRQFTVAVPFSSFTDVTTSFTPLSIRHSTSPL